MMGQKMTLAFAALDSDCWLLVGISQPEHHANLEKFQSAGNRSSTAAICI
jgi:hypothetical protein